MSRIHLNRFLASVMLVLVFTVQTFAVQGFRPFAPYARDEFGGGPRQAQGVYGILEAVYLTFEPTKDITIGLPNTPRYAYTGNVTIQQSNTINTSHLDTMGGGVGTKFEIGNIRGHWGWSIGGYGIPNMEISVDNANGSVVIGDPQNLVAYPAFGTGYTFNRVWKENGPFDTIPNLAGPVSAIQKVGYLWAWFPAQLDTVTPPTLEGTLAPLPINFEKARVTAKMDHWVVDALTTYRFHPSRLGNFEMFAGVRYMEIDDSLNFFGEGLPWMGITEEFDDSTLDADGNPTSTLEGTVSGVGSILGNSDWKFQAQNHIIAPQIGARISRKNNRWTLSAEGRFLAGGNYQNVKSSGYFGSYYDRISEVDFGDTTLPGLTERGMYPWTPVGPLFSTRSFYHNKSRVEFSPGVEVKVNANWQVTNAVGIQFGVNAMYMDKIAKGAYVNDYSIQENGTFFGLNDSSKYNDSAFVYGFTVGLTVNRW